MFKRLGTTQRNFVISGLSQLAIHQTRWIRPVELWYPESNRTEEQFFELSRHFFNRYEILHTLQNAWFEGDPDERQIQQSWFKHIGNGQSIRTAEDLPFKLTKRAAHPPGRINLRLRPLSRSKGEARTHDACPTTV